MLKAGIAKSHKSTYISKTYEKKIYIKFNIIENLIKY